MMMYPFGRRWHRRYFGLNPLLVSLFSGWLLIRSRADGSGRRRSGLWTFLLILLLIRPFFF